MSAPALVYRPKLPFYGLSFSKSPIKNHATLFGLGWVGSGRQTGSNKTKFHKAQQCALIIIHVAYGKFITAVTALIRNLQVITKTKEPTNLDSK